MKLPLISVIIPVYNVGRFIEQSIRSIISQTYENLEIIIIDDGSTDGSAETCDKLRAEDSRIILIHQSNGGPSLARNMGLDICKGEYISFVDGDDFIEPTMIEDLYHLIIDYGADMSQCDFNVIKDGALVDNPVIADPVITVYDRPAIDQLLVRLKGSDVVQWNKLYKREILDGLRFPPGKFHEDEYVFYKEYDRCSVFVHTTKRLYNYVLREGSTMHSQNVAKRIMYIEALDERIAYFKIRGNKDRAYSAYERARHENRRIKEKSGQYSDYNENIGLFKRKWRHIVFKPANYDFLLRKIKGIVYKRLLIKK